MSDQHKAKASRKHYGLIVPIVTRLCWFRPLTGIPAKLLGSRLSAIDKVKDDDRAQKYCIRIDLLVALRLAFAVLLLVFAALAAPGGSLWTSVACVAAALLLMDVMANAGRVALAGEDDDYIDTRRLVFDPGRIVLLGLVNYLELILGFAVIYTANLGCLRETTQKGFKAVESCGDALYFSVITQLTIGYGDISPTGWLRLAASLQGLAGVVLLVLLVGQFVNALPPSVGLRQYRREKSSEENEHSKKSK